MLRDLGPELRPQGFVNHVSIPAYPPPAERPGGPGAPPHRKLGFSVQSQGDPPNQYFVSFQGRSLWRDRGKVKTLDTHRVEIKLGSSYPRTMPEIRWITPIYHPNISEIGMVCLGGYGTHWVPSVQLDELCIMLWDMARYHNYDIRSPYNRDAALWVANQTAILFPTDARPLRDIRAALGRIAPSDEASTRFRGGLGGHDKRQLTANPTHRPPDDSSQSGRSRPPVHRALSSRLRSGRHRTAGAHRCRAELPSNSELQALATAVAASTPAMLANATEELIVLDSPRIGRAAAIATANSQPASDEIVFIE